MSDDGASAGQHEGRTVGGGRYRLGDLLGAGGMASVYLAHDSVLDRQVAVKTLHTELGREESFRERFRREAQSVAKLTHTNIVSVFDTGEDEVDGAMVPYIVMEYVEGKPLRSVLDEDVAQYGAMPTDKALKITADVLAALDVSHEMGLVHRDIKPGNVMITRRGVVKVMDFGIARAMQSGVTSMTQTGMVVGTPQYLSPEQALGRGVDARSDLYSVGIMLFELITGRLPFDADSPLAIAYAHVQEEAVAPSTINQSVPPGVDALIARTLRKNPNERFPNAEAMRAECERIGGSGAASGVAPLIISGGPAAHSGSGVSQAVFPAASPTGTPQPYPAGQYDSGAGFAPTPVPGAHTGQQGYSTPPPAGYPQQGGVATPPPYAMPKGGGPGGGKSNTPIVVGSVIAAIVVITAIIIAINLSGGGGGGGGDDDNPSADSSKSSATPDEKAPGFKGPDKTKTIEVTRCTEASEHYSDPGKKRMPSFYLKNLDSVKQCLDAAGWKYELNEEDENLWGKDTVMSQTPKEYDPFDPSSTTIQLTVSTGLPADN